jgi:uncharacterized protein YkwD
MTPLAILVALLSLSPLANDALPLKKDPIPVNKTLLLQLVNQVRQKGCQCGDTWYPAAPPLSWSTQLEKAALIHSNDMYANKYFAHAAKDGSKAGERIDQVGYRWRTYGENIAFGYRTEKEVVKGWLTSPGHCKNIMGAAFKEVGVSRVGEYWTQVFATK